MQLVHWSGRFDSCIDQVAVFLYSSFSLPLSHCFVRPHESWKAARFGFFRSNSRIIGIVWLYLEIWCLEQGLSVDEL
jgi:hypothetical protein